MLFAERGGAVTLNEIAHHAGVGVGTVYRHFPDREQLVEGLFEERIDQMETLLRSALDESDPWHGLSSFLERALELQAADRGLREVALGAAGAFRRVAKARARLQPLAEQLVERARQSGELRADIEAQDLPLMQLMLTSVSDVSRSVEPHLWRRYLAILLQGLRANPRRPEPLPVASPPLEQLDRMMLAGFEPRRRATR